MYKYIAVLVVIMLGAFLVWLLFQNKDSINNSFVANTSDNVLAPVAPGIVTDANPITNPNNNQKIMNAILNTSMGNITIEFFRDQSPATVANFTKLAGEGFYNGIKFHRVIKGFMIQGGDPLTKDDSKMALWGTGDPGYKFADEIDSKSDLYTKTGYKKGIVAMANSGPNTNGSQFFIMTEDYPLPSSYTIFGKVTAGQDVVDKIANVSTNAGDRPITAVVIKNISLK
jgi:cyclophilin family peptidyl-prolyl cis-trans isomerase